ncbi:MAG: sulfatase-like hydrolase/transferase [Candidatus Binatia bacterium]|nr:sulfatase-like hydrolase/transferase [Candidatus Binatia bacterium]
MSPPRTSTLSREGVRFDRAYAASGMCSPTRATLLTGLMPSQHGLHNALSDPWVDQQGPGWSGVGEFRTLSLTLANRGYQMAMIGKWHLGDPRRPDLGFGHWVAIPYGHTIDFWHNELVENGDRRRIDERHIVDALAEEAVEYLEEVDPSRPFYLQLNLDGPYALPPAVHGPARNRHYARHEGRRFESMPLEPVSDHILTRLQGPYIRDQELFKLRDIDLIWDHLLHRTIRMQGDPASYANFLSQNEVVDDAVGRVREVLEARGLMENTVLVYTADQGNGFGQHGHWGHTIWRSPAHLFDEAMRIPLIIVDPGGFSGVSETLVGQYDMASTLLELAGVKDVQFEGSPGRSFAAEVRGELEGARGRAGVFFEQEESRGIRTERHAYWKRLEGFGEPELYDMQADPEQRVDLYPAMKGSPLVEELDSRLEEFFDRHSAPQYDLWREGVSKGIPPKPFEWVLRNPWPWLEKYWRDFVWRDSLPARFQE